MKIEVVFKLPDQDEMTKRLFAIGCTQDLRERFFPLLIKHAGEEVNSQKVIELLATAIEDYTQTMPESVIHSIKLLMYVNARLFIRALVDDEASAAEIKQYFMERI